MHRPILGTNFLSAFVRPVLIINLLHTHLGSDIVATEKSYTLTLQLQDNYLECMFTVIALQINK